MLALNSVMESAYNIVVNRQSFKHRCLSVAFNRLLYWLECATKSQKLRYIHFHIWLWQSCTLPKQTKVDYIRSYIPVFICLHWPNNLKHIWKTHIKNYANGLHFVVFHYALLVVEFIHIFQCCYTERAVIIRLRQRQWSSLEDHMDPQKHTNVCNIHVHISLRWELRICTDRLTPSLWFKLSIQRCSDNRKPPR